MNKLICLAFLFMSSLSYAKNDCLFPPCPPPPPPPTKAEINQANKVFNKTKYILGAAFDVQNRNNGTTYKNIPDFIQKTKALRKSIKSLYKQANKVNAQLNGAQLATAVLDINLCVKFDQNAIQYCNQAFDQLKSYYWDKSFGDDWSGYPVMHKWSGFPKSLQ